MSGRASSILVLAGLAVVACASPSEEACPPVPPARMPDGNALQPAVGQSVDGEARVLIWRSGDAFVLQRIFLDGANGERACPAGHLAGPSDCLAPAGTTVRGIPAVFAPTTAENEWFVAWASGECRYETVFGRLLEPEARAYVVGY